MDIMLLLVIFVVGIVAYKVVFKSETAVGIGAKYFTTTCTMKLDALPEGASNFLEVGTDVYDNETNTYIGYIRPHLTNHRRSRRFDCNCLLPRSFPSRSKPIRSMKRALMRRQYKRNSIRNPPELQRHQSAR
jgi:hypothetical protein